MREETQLEPPCALCGQPITQRQWPYKALQSGEYAHLPCYLDSLQAEEKKPETRER
ncbi:MAG: hypothetical protein WCF26_06900 [Candidatus Sulfotelmatobacter sp.]